MNPVQELSEQMAKQFNYKKLPPQLSQRVRQIYKDNVPKYYQEHGKHYTYYSLGYKPVCKGYNRIVIGDYGAYVEFTSEQACTENFIIEPGQEYRLEPRYQVTEKYIWYRVNSLTDTKIYYQINPVDYANYQPGMYYVSVYDLIPHI